MSQHQQLMRIDLEDNFALKDEEREIIVKNFIALLKPGSIVVISDYAKGVIDEALIQVILQKAKLYGCMVLVDPKGPDFSKYKNATYMKPNLKEFNQIVSRFLT